RGLCSIAVRERHEAETSRPSRLAVGDDLRFDHVAEAFKGFTQALIIGVPAETPDKQLVTHRLSSLVPRAMQPGLLDRNRSLSLLGFGSSSGEGPRAMRLSGLGAATSSVSVRLSETVPRTLWANTENRCPARAEETKRRWPEQGLSGASRLALGPACPAARRDRDALRLLRSAQRGACIR